MKFSLKKRQFFILFLVIGLGIFYKNFLLKKVNNKAINIALTSKVSSFDPANAYNDNAILVISQSLQPLFQYHYLKRPYEVIPLLAEKLPEITNEGRTYTIKIKEGIEYHPHSAFKGNKRFVTAQDFVNQFSRLIDPFVDSNGRWGLIDKVVGAREYYERRLSLKKSNPQSLKLEFGFEGIKALDELTLEINLIKPDISFIYFLAMTFAAPVPIELLQYTNNDLRNVLVGTGPFILTSSDENKLLFKSFSYYHNENYPSSGDRYANSNELIVSANQKLPFLEEIHILTNKEEHERYELYKDKKLDYIDVPAKFLSQIIANKSLNIELKHFSNLSARWLAFNMKDKLLGGNKNLRLAIAHGIDFEKYIRDIKGGTNYLANSIYSPGIPGYQPGNKRKYNYNLEMAKKYMEKAGYLEGKGLPVIRYTTRSMQESSIIEGEFIKEELSKIGIKVVVEKVEFSEFLKKGRAGELQFFTDQWIYDYPDAENLIQLLLSKNSPGMNKSSYSNSKVDILYDKYTHSNSLDERINIMKSIEDIIENELPWIMLSYESSYILQNKRVKNLRKSSMIRNFIKYLKVEE